MQKHIISIIIGIEVLKHLVEDRLVVGILKQVYEDMSEYYDIIYNDMTDAEFYLNQAKKSKGSVLEIGCGTGRILIYLAKHGIDITGLDISDKMLEKLKQKAQKQGLDIELFVRDMREFSLDKKFSLIILPYRSFLHLKNNKERLSALTCIKKHLLPEGKVIIHTCLPTEQELKITEFQVIDNEIVETKHGKFTVSWEFKYEPKQNRGQYRIMLSESNTKLLKTFNMGLYFVPEAEMHALLKKSGFKRINLYYNFSCSDVNPCSGEMLWFADK